MVSTASQSVPSLQEIRRPIHSSQYVLLGSDERQIAEAWSFHRSSMVSDRAEDGTYTVTLLTRCLFVFCLLGTSWYHSHFSAQYGDGTWGAIVIKGPSTAEVSCLSWTRQLED